MNSEGLPSLDQMLRTLASANRKMQRLKAAKLEYTSEYKKMLSAVNRSQGINVRSRRKRETYSIAKSQAYSDVERQYRSAIQFMMKKTPTGSANPGYISVARVRKRAAQQAESNRAQAFNARFGIESGTLNNAFYAFLNSPEFIKMSEILGDSDVIVTAFAEAVQPGQQLTNADTEDIINAFRQYLSDPTQDHYYIEDVEDLFNSLRTD